MSSDLGGQCRKLLIFAVRPPHIEDEVLALDETDDAQTIAQPGHLIDAQGGYFAGTA